MFAAIIFTLLVYWFAVEVIAVACGAVVLEVVWKLFVCGAVILAIIKIARRF